MGAGTVSISGEVDGDVELAARQITILPTTRIQGNLTYRSPEPANIAPKAQIMGTVTHVPVEAKAGMIELAGPVFRGILILSLLLAGIVLIMLFPNFGILAARTVGSDPWKSLGLGLGLALLVTTPIAASLLMATVIGMPLGFAILAFYFVTLLTGFRCGYMTSNTPSGADCAPPGFPLRIGKTC